MDLLQRLTDEFADAVALHAASAEDAVDGVTPRAVAAPRDVEAVQALVAWCGRESIAFVARGGGTRLGLGARPERCDLVISTENLNRVIEHDAGNATVTAEAGITLAALNDVVGQNGQFVPLDGTVGGSRGTLGGTVATNHGGMSRLKYGTPRDLVVGLHAALSDGRFVKAGSKVVKNVSGYDLNKIFTGSHGTLGLITQVTLRLRPHDVMSQSWHGSYDSWEAVAGAASSILEGAFEPTGLRVLADGRGWLLMARFDGGETAVRTQIARLPVSAQDVDEDERAGADLAGQLLLRVVLPRQSALQWAQLAHASGAAMIAWDCGLGVVRAAFNTAADVATLRAVAVEHGGFMVVDAAPHEFKTPDFVWGAPRSDFALLQGLKRTFDAARVCAPGRSIGGI